MPIFVEWKWVEKTKTFLAIFHFWDDEKRKNLRMRLEEDGFETCVYAGSDEEEEGNLIPIDTLPHYILGYPKTKAYLSWAPSHPEFCFLTEILTYANLLNGMKTNEREKFKSKLQGKALKENREGKAYTYFEIDSKLFHSIPEGAMVSFAGQDGISFEVSLEYVEYLRELLRIYLQS